MVIGNSALAKVVKSLDYSYTDIICQDLVDNDELQQQQEVCTTTTIMLEFLPMLTMY